MKVLLIIAAVCIVSAFGELTEEQKMVLRGFKTDCMKAHTFDENWLMKAKDGEWNEDQEFMCFFDCMLKKINVLNDDGTFNEEKTRKKIGYDLAADKVDSVMMKCKDMHDDMMCKTAWMMMKCYADERAFITMLTEKAA